MHVHVSVCARVVQRETRDQDGAVSSLAFHLFKTGCLTELRDELAREPGDPLVSEPPL